MAEKRIEPLFNSEGELLCPVNGEPCVCVDRTDAKCCQPDCPCHELPDWLDTAVRAQAEAHRLLNELEADHAE